MTDKKSRRVVIINNINSETIDQAIFILKSDRGDIRLSNENNTDIVREAQKIIDNYVRQVERFKSEKSTKKTAREKRRKRRNIYSFLLTALFCLAVCFVFVGYIMN